jgi:hypothetical protein
MKLIKRCLNCQTVEQVELDLSNEPELDSVLAESFAHVETHKCDGGGLGILLTVGFVE